MPFCNYESENKYHHGNLREALVLAGLELIENEVVEVLTLRKCAIRQAFHMLRLAHHLDGIKAKGTDYCSWTCSICNGHTALFKIMFQPHDVVSAELNELTSDMFLKKTNASYQVLREACAAFGQNKAMTKSNSTTNNSP